MKLYRIFTERKRTPEVTELVAGMFPGFSLFEGIGYWKGQQELFLCIEIIASDIDAASIVHLASKIKKRNAQESVMIETLPVTVDFI